MTEREKIIANYIDGYNQFDIDKMIADFDDNIIFQNISNGETNMSLQGISSFKLQAEQAIDFFSTRTQSIQSFKHNNNETEVDIAYYGILAMELPDGRKKGDEVSLKGRSVFTFNGNKIIKLTDIS